MTHAPCVEHAPTLRPAVLIAALLTGVTVFLLGQYWSGAGISLDTPSVSVTEDWHGNVKRSNWPD